MILFVLRDLPTTNKHLKQEAVVYKRHTPVCINLLRYTVKKKFKKISVNFKERRTNFFFYFFLITLRIFEVFA